MRGLAAPPGHAGAQAALVERLELDALGDHGLGLGEEDELLEPGGQELGAVVRVDRHLTRDGLSVPRLVVAAEQLGERARRVLEHGGLGCGLDPQLELARVVDPAVHPSHDEVIP